MTETTFIATGDSIITRRISSSADRDVADLVDLVKTADAAFTNLEITTPRAPWIPSSEFGGMHLAAAPFVLDELRRFGFNLFSLANNHVIDYTTRGLTDTFAELELREMVYAGAGRDLGDARSPAYWDSAAGRFALLAAASSYPVGAAAAARRVDTDGRPGLNPLRFETRHELDRRRFEQLAEIDETLGSAAVTREKRAFGVFPTPPEGAYVFVDHNFFEAERAAIRTKCNERDRNEMARWIQEAHRQADYVVLSLHAHEGPNSSVNSDEPADFVVEAARSWIDAGANVFVGHGPHVTRAIEIYRGCPIFYSLGNFIFMTETVRKLPAEMYEYHKLPEQSTPADVYDHWSKTPDGAPRGFHAEAKFWESVVARCRFRDGTLTGLELHPVTLGLEAKRPARGCPRLADRPTGERILSRLAELSTPYGTVIRIEARDSRCIGHVELGEP